MKKLLSIALAGVMVVALAACGGSSSSTTAAATTAAATTAASGDATTAAAADDFEGNPITLKLSHNNAVGTPLYNALQVWCDAVNEATHGTVTIEQYPSEQLGATKEGITMLETGIADLLWATTGMFSNQFNYLDSFSLPMLGIDSSVNGTNQVWDLMDSEYGHYVEEEFAGMKLLLIFQSEGGIIGSNEKIEKVSDINGKVIRSVAGAMADYATVCGASPTFMGPGDIYLNMQKKVIDAFIFEWAGVESFTLGEEVPYFLDINLYRVPGFTVMSDLAWNKLSEDQQNAILSVSLRDASLAVAEVYDEAEAAYKEKVSGMGTELVVPADDVIAEWEANAEQVYQMRKDAITDGEAFVDEVLKLVGKK